MGWVSIPPLHAEQVRLEQNVQLCIRWPPSEAYAMGPTLRHEQLHAPLRTTIPKVPSPGESGQQLSHPHVGAPAKRWRSGCTNLGRRHPKMKMRLRGGSFLSSARGQATTYLHSYCS